MIEENKLKTTVTEKGKTLTVTLLGAIDHHQAAEARKKIDTALFKHRPERLILDLEGVDFMDSSGLGLILGRAALCEELGTSLVLRRPSPRVKKIFAVAGITRFSHIQTEE